MSEESSLVLSLLTQKLLNINKIQKHLAFCLSLFFKLHWCALNVFILRFVYIMIIIFFQILVIYFLSVIKHLL